MVRQLASAGAETDQDQEQRAGLALRSKQEEVGTHGLAMEFDVSGKQRLLRTNAIGCEHTHALRHARS